jgi:hypothetical protein
MEVDPRFPTKLDALSDVPEPLRGALEETLPANQTFHLLLHAPAFQADGEESPATVLAVTDTAWLVASETEDGGATIENSDFNNTLFLELTSILLLGELRITFAAVDTAYSVTLKFETVGEELYREAVDLILAGIDPSLGMPGDGDLSDLSLLESWPMRIRNAAQRFLPKGKRYLAALHWPAVPASGDREFVPAGALLVTARKVVIVSEETGSLVEPSNEGPAVAEVVEQLHGTTSFIPRVRLADFHVSHEDHLGVLALQVQAPHGGEIVEVTFPSDQERAVSKVMDVLGLRPRLA